ncbi:MAG: DUF559 domain-containing protein [Verrucomicrobiae bacterium]|nr:DUF559 domain-containing protein [Verrucomicrobiae bacterium]
MVCANDAVVEISDVEDVVGDGHLVDARSAYTFRRNHPCGIYFGDFSCMEASLSIELDGGQRVFPKQQAPDAERTKFLASMGIKELQF